MLYLIGKRAIDIFGACIGLAITSLLAIPIAVIVLMDSPGPLLFTQKRLGKDERVFRVYKFRTMHIHAASDGTKPKADDNNVTRAGRFLSVRAWMNYHNSGMCCGGR